jgi:regulatory protein YycH of two-component signal transduction system YycFG
MGMKYLEPIKSFLLFFLVALSLTLTVMIWNYKPNHQFIEEEQSEDISIGPRIEIEKTLKPYRVLARTEDSFKGSVASSYSVQLLKHLKTAIATDLSLVDNNLTNAQMNELMYINNRITLFYGAEIPLQVFTKVLPFENTDLPEMSFNRLIIDWNNLEKSRVLNILFLNTKNKTLYQTSIQSQSYAKFNDAFIEPLNKFQAYQEYKTNNGLSIYTTSDAVEAVKYMYSTNDLSTDQFKEVLFEEASIVQKTDISTFTEKYTDDKSFMMLDKKSRILNYVYPASEGVADIVPSSLLNDSFHYVNDHGGFNGDYRVMNINREKHVVEYQMFYQGFPVFSSETTTKITTTWGDDQVHQYRRPFYILDVDITDEELGVELSAGKDMLDRYLKDKDVQDIVLGYYLVQNMTFGVFELVPSWFFLKNNGSWEYIKVEEIGGMTSGLE